ncbi:ubiquitin-like protein ATG12, partial [Huso huso]
MSESADSSAEPSAETATVEETAGSADEKKKIDILLKAVGDAPIMKTKKWSVERSRTVQALGLFIKKFLKLEPAEQLFIYVNQSFAPPLIRRWGPCLSVSAVMGSWFFITVSLRLGG